MAAAARKRRAAALLARLPPLACRLHELGEAPRQSLVGVLLATALRGRELPAGEPLEPGCDRRWVVRRDRFPRPRIAHDSSRLRAIAEHDDRALRREILEQLAGGLAAAVPRGEQHEPIGFALKAESALVRQVSGQHDALPDLRGLEQSALLGR